MTGFGGKRLQAVRERNFDDQRIQAWVAIEYRPQCPVGCGIAAERKDFFVVGNAKAQCRHCVRDIDGADCPVSNLHFVAGGNDNEFEH